MPSDTTAAMRARRIRALAEGQGATRPLAISRILRVQRAGDSASAPGLSAQRGQSGPRHPDWTDPRT